MVLASHQRFALHQRQVNLFPGAPPASSSSAVIASSSSAAVSSAAVSSVVSASVASSSAVIASSAGSAVPTAAATPSSSGLLNSILGSSAILSLPVTSALKPSSTGSSSVPRIVTSTSTVAPSSLGSLPTLAPLSNGTANDSTTGSGGLSHTTLIAIIVVASCIAGIAAIWTIIRKTKFSPSKRFESKLEPIDFIPSGRIGENHHQRNNESQGSFNTYPATEEKFTGGMAGFGAGNAAHYAGSLERSDSEKSRNANSAGPDPSYGGYGNQYPNQNYQQQHAAGYPAQPAQYGYSDLQRGPPPPPNANHRAYLNGTGQPGYYEPQQGRY